MALCGSAASACWVACCWLRPSSSPLLDRLLLLLLGRLLLLLELVEALLVVGGLGVEGHGDQERSIGAGAEAVADQVVGATQRRRLGQLAVVLLAQPQIEYRRREDAEDQDADRDR